MLLIGTMAMPGEAETNYNIKRPIWEVLKLPFGPHVEGVKDKGLMATLSLKRRYFLRSLYHCMSFPALSH